MAATFLRNLKARLITRRMDAARSRMLRHRLPGETLDGNDYSRSLADPTAYYVQAFRDFHDLLPEPLREHRAYFNREGRGFGEDAFHVMWWRLVRELRPRNFLEIGVYRGQVLSLVSLLARREGLECAVTGLSPFSPAGDSVSTYLRGLDYRSDTLANFDHFGLPAPRLVKAFSTDPSALAVIAETSWDLIYIDGNHDYGVVLGDWASCGAALRAGGHVVLDDSGLTTAYRPPVFATGGHPGPSRLASEIDRGQFREVLQVGHNRVFQKLG